MRNNKLMRGTLSVELTGTNTESFFNLCADRAICVTDVRKTGAYSASFTVPVTERERMLKAAHSCACEAEITGELGLPRTVRRLGRAWLPVTLAALLALLLWGSELFLWDIRVTENNSEVPESEILHVLETQGVRVGAFHPKLKNDLIASGALPQLPGLSYLSLSIHGSRADVTVRKSDPVPQLQGSDMGADLVAAHAGVLTETRVLEGIQLVHAGEAVTEGQVLVSGKRNALTDGVRLVRARAEITGRTWRELTVIIPLTVAGNAAPMRERNAFSLIFGKSRIKIYPNSRFSDGICDKITNWKRLSLGKSFSLPIGILEEHIIPSDPTEYETEELIRDAKELLTRRMETMLGEDGELLRTYFSVGEAAERLTVTMRAECSERLERELPLVSP